MRVVWGPVSGVDSVVPAGGGSWSSGVDSGVDRVISRSSNDKICGVGSICNQRGYAAAWGEAEGCCRAAGGGVKVVSWPGFVPIFGAVLRLSCRRMDR